MKEAGKANFPSFIERGTKPIPKVKYKHVIVLNCKYIACIQLYWSIGEIPYSLDFAYFS